MPAIKSHKTATDEGAWDGPRMVANAKSGESSAYYGRIYAWRDPEADDTTKAAYKLPHHLVSSDGEPGAASVKGCQSAIGVLNGARGGADIPDSDRRSVYNHLASHLNDADVEPAELRVEPRPARPEGLERRALEVGELRVEPAEGAEGAEGPAQIVGHAAVFESMSVDLGGFREVIHPGAFAKTIQEHDIRALQNHNADRVLGRNRAGTLELAEDDQGLAFSITPPPATWAEDLMASMARGDVDQCSFSFEAVRDRWVIEGGELGQSEITRHLDEVRLYDISVVTFPAYPETTSEVRAHVRDLQAAAPAQVGHPAEGAEDEADARVSLDLLRRRLDLAERE